MANKKLEKVIRERKARKERGRKDYPAYRKPKPRSNSIYRKLTLTESLYKLLLQHQGVLISHEEIKKSIYGEKKTRDNTVSVLVYDTNRDLKSRDRKFRIFSCSVEGKKYYTIFSMERVKKFDPSNIIKLNLEKKYENATGDFGFFDKEDLFNEEDLFDEGDLI